MNDFGVSFRSIFFLPNSSPFLFYSFFYYHVLERLSGCSKGMIDVEGNKGREVGGHLGPPMGPGQSPGEVQVAKPPEAGDFQHF
jgi:hypothetical protein